MQVPNLITRLCFHTNSLASLVLTMTYINVPVYDTMIVISLNDPRLLHLLGRSAEDLGASFIIIDIVISNRDKTGAVCNTLDSERIITQRVNYSTKGKHYK